MLAVILFWVFTCCILVQCVYACYFFWAAFPLKFPQAAPKKPDSSVLSALIDGTNNSKKIGHELPVSIIICARNEAGNLQKNLPAIFAQRYENAGGERNFEVIVVDDCSDDETAAVLSEFAAFFPELRIVTILPHEDRTLPGKKYPLSRGMAIAKHEFLLLTDADCYPATNFWISEMMIPLSVSGSHGQIVGGYGKLATGKGLLNAFSRWETLHTFLQFTGYAAKGLSYMVVGRNLACRKNVLLSAQQSPLWKVTPSGDDDLLVRLTTDMFHDRRTVQICRSVTSATISQAKESWRGWMRQKQRHVSTGKLYRPQIQALLGGYALTHTLVWVLIITLLFTRFAVPAMLLMLVRCAIYWIIWARAAKQLEEPGLTYYFPLFDIGWMVYNFVLSPFIFWKNKQQWT